MGEKLFITGICGFIGRHVAREAIRRGYEVYGIDIQHTPIEGAKITICDITDKEGVAKAMDHPDYVIHLAAITSNLTFKEVLEGCYKINVLGFINVIDAAANAGVKKFVYASSSAVYIDGFSENTKLDIEKQENHYGRTKIMDEMIAASYADIKKPMKVIGLRYFNTYGPTGEKKPRASANMINNFLKARREGEPLVIYGDGTQKREFLYIDDCVNFTLGILEKGTEQIYNVGSGESHSFTEVAKLISKRIEYIENPIPKSQYQFYTKADTRRLLKLFPDYKFVGLEEGIKRSDYINIATISMAKPVRMAGVDLADYAANLTTAMQRQINGKADNICALSEFKHNDVKGLMYAHTLFKNKVKKLAKGDYNIIHITNQELGFLAKLLKQSGFDGKIVTTIHDAARFEDAQLPGIMQKTYNNIVRNSVRDALQYSDYVIYDSEQTPKLLGRHLNVGNNWKVIPLGISDNVLSPKPDLKKPASEYFRISYLGSLAHNKNPIFVLKTAEAFRGINGKHKFTIYGHGPEQAELLNYMISKKLDNVEINDYRSLTDHRQAYDKADVFIYPTLHEGFGLTILEAQARGLPVVIYKNGQVPEEVRKYCFEAENEGHAAELLKELKDNGYDSKKRKKAMDYARGFTWDNTAMETIKLYKTLLD